MAQVYGRGRKNGKDSYWTVWTVGYEGYWFVLSVKWMFNGPGWSYTPECLGEDAKEKTKEKKYVILKIH